MIFRSIKLILRSLESSSAPVRIVFGIVSRGERPDTHAVQRAEAKFEFVFLPKVHTQHPK